MARRSERFGAGNAPSIADLDATARAAGNRSTSRPRSAKASSARRGRRRSVKSRANEIGSHLIVGVRLWGVKFHRAADASGVRPRSSRRSLRKTFAAAPAVEEVDVWASIPIEVGKGDGRQRRSRPPTVAHGVQPRRRGAANLPSRFRPRPTRAIRPTCFGTKSGRAPPSRSRANSVPTGDSALVYRKTTLPSGLRVLTETMPSVRSATVGVWADVGSSLESGEKRGISHFVEHMLFKGTKAANGAADRRNDGRRRRKPQRVHR